MRRALIALTAALALAGCASTSYYRDGSADYYYERDYAPSTYGYLSYGYGSGFGGYGFYDPFWGAHSFYGGWSPYGFGSYYAGWNYSPWYDGWGGGNFYDWSRWQRQQEARNRAANVRGEAAAIGAMQRDLPRGRDSAAALDGPGRLAAPGNSDGARLRGPNRWGNADESRQLRTEAVDPYYGVPRQRRGESAPMRESQWRQGERPQRFQPGVNGGGIPERDSRPIRTGPAFRDTQIGGPAPGRAPTSGRAPAPQREFAPQPIRSAPSAPSFDRAPSFSPRSAPSSAPVRDGGGGGRSEQRR